MASAIIETHELTKEYGPLTAVDALTLSIGRGEIFGLLGPNGAGKTTTISMLVTLLQPTRGSASVNGYDILRQPREVRESIGIVFQDPSLDTALTAWENLELHGRLYGLTRETRKARSEELLQVVDLTDRKHHLVKTFSGGMKRRLELARGLMHNPAVLFLDEPTLGLDPQTRAHTWNYIRRMAKENQTTIVMTTHYMEEADMMCERVGIIDHGKIIALDTPASLKQGLGGDLVRLRAPSFDPKRLDGLGYVRKIEEEGGFVNLTVEHAERNLPEILSRVGPIESVEVRVPTLNDVFLEYTGHSMREEEGSGEGWLDSVMRMNQGGR